MHANEQLARTYIGEMTGLSAGRVESSFEHRITFEVPALSQSDVAEILERLGKRGLKAFAVPDGGAYKVEVGAGKRLLLSSTKVTLQQVCESSENLERQLHGAWQAIAEEGLHVENNAEALELCLDADRMTTMCGEKGEAADREVDELIKMFGYEKVVAMLDEKVKLL